MFSEKAKYIKNEKKLRRETKPAFGIASIVLKLRLFLGIEFWR